MLKQLVSFWSSAWQPWPFRPAMPDLPQGERRALPRHPGNQEVFCRLLSAVGHVTRWPGLIQDVSAGGMGLVVNHPFPPEALLAIEWNRPIPKLPLALSVRVVRARAHAGGFWSVGCAFASDLAPSQLQALVEALQ